MSTSPRLMTAEEFYEFTFRPDNAERSFELDEGRVIELPVVEHGDALPNLALLLCGYCERRGKGDVSVNDEPFVLCRDPDTVRSPDVMFHDEDRTRDDVDDGTYLESPPLLAVEILSPEIRYGYLARKLSQYLQAGVRLIWLVDPLSRDVTVCRPGSVPVVVGPGNVLDCADVLPGLSVPVADLFRTWGGK